MMGGFVEDVVDTIGGVVEDVVGGIGDIAGGIIGGGIGYAVGGWPGAAIGAGLGAGLGDALAGPTAISRDLLERSIKLQEDIFGMQKEIYNTLKSKLPQAEATLREQYDRASEEARRALGLGFGALAQTQAQHGRLLARSLGMGFMSTGGMENIYRASAEELSRAALGLYGQYSGILAELEKDLGVKLVALPVEYLRGATGALSVAPSYLSGVASLMQAQPPSLFDRLIGVGSVLKLFM